MGNYSDGAVPNRADETGGSEPLPANVEDSGDDSLIIQRAVLLELTNDDMTLHTIGINVNDGYAYLKAFVQATESTKGLTRQ